MLELKIALYLLRMMLARSFHLAIGMEDAKETLGIDEGIVHIVIDTMQLTDGRTDIGKEHHMVHNLSYRHAWIIDEHQIGSEDNDEHSTYLLEETL